MKNLDDDAVGLGCEILEGIYEIIDISPNEDKKVLHKIAFMIESLLEKDYDVIVENKTPYEVRKLDS